MYAGLWCLRGDRVRLYLSSPPCDSEDCRRRTDRTDGRKDGRTDGEAIRSSLTRVSRDRVVDRPTMTLQWPPAGMSRRSARNWTRESQRLTTNGSSIQRGAEDDTRKKAGAAFAAGPDSPGEDLVDTRRSVVRARFTLIASRPRYSHLVQARFEG